MRATMAIVGTILLTLLVVGIACAAPFKIDSFNDGTQAILVNKTAPIAWSIIDTTEALGGERDLYLEWKLGDNLNVNLRTNTGNDGLFSYSADPTMESVATVTWDGQEPDPNHGSAPVLNQSGLGSVSLTAGGNDGILARLTWADLAAALTFQVYSGADWSESTITLPPLNPGVRMDAFFPFNTIGGVPGFTVKGGAGADFAQVGAIQMILDGRVVAGADVMIDLVESSRAREYGDLPIQYGTSVLSANHIPQGLRLGTNVDAEDTYHASIYADGDDIDQATPDDEDGIVPQGLPWIGAGNKRVRVTVTGCSLDTNPDGCWLYGWIDWNHDFIFESGELVYGANVSDMSLNQNIYFSGVDDSPYYSRWRICMTEFACDSPDNTDTNVPNGEVEDYWWILTPTAVELASFTATPQAWTGRVLLEWETVSEVDNLGFNLYRAESPDGRQIKLNASLIPSQEPGSPIGFKYSFADRTARAGRTYYYWLEAVDIHDRMTRFGPVSAAIPLQLSSPKAKP